MQLPNHPDHDPLLISALAAGNLDADQSARASALVDSCASCAELHRDLIAIAAATRAMPRLGVAPRDLRLSAEQAARLRRGGWLRSVLAPFGGARSAARPIAAAFTTLGIAGVLVATLLPGMLGSAASLAPERNRSLTGIGPSAAPVAAPGATAAAAPGATAAAGPLVPVAGGATAAPAPVATGDANFGSKDGSTTEAPEVAVIGGSSTGGSSTGSPATDTGGRLSVFNPPSPLLTGSLALLAVGVLLFGLRYAGRRLR
jgi:hypothetical protein